MPVPEVFVPECPEAIVVDNPEDPSDPFVECTETGMPCPSDGACDNGKCPVGIA